MAKDLTGMKIGRWTVLKINEEESKKPRGKNGRKMRYWDCICDCGTVKPVLSQDLTKQKTLSCGCLQKERVSQMWENEDFRHRKIEQTKKIFNELWQDEEYRKAASKRMSITAKKLWQDEDFVEMRKHIASEQLKSRWNSEDYRKSYREKMSGEKSPRWKGGTNEIRKHLRTLNIKWFSDCKDKAGYKCQLTNKPGNGKNLNTHHLYSFSNIIFDAHNIYNIQIKEQVKDYTENELKLIEEYVAIWHSDNSNAVVLCKEAHELFHKLYGKGNNTPEQYMEFKERYLAGEFKEILK